MRHGSCVEVFQGKRNDYYGAVSSQYVHFQKSSHYRQGDHGRRSESPYTSNSMPAQQLRGNVGSHLQMHQGPQGQPHMGRPRGSSRSDSRSKAAGRGRGGGIQVGEHTGYLRMRGLPFTTTKEEIFEFFKGYDPIVDYLLHTVVTEEQLGRVTLLFQLLSYRRVLWVSIKRVSVLDTSSSSLATRRNMVEQSRGNQEILHPPRSRNK